MADKVSKGRSGSFSGEKNPAAKLTAEKVGEIRILLAGGERVTAVARQFGVCHQLVSQIKAGTIWKRLAEAGVTA